MQPDVKSITHTSPTTITCGQCGHQEKITQVHCFDQQLHPAWKERLLDGSVYHCVCPVCGFVSEFGYPCRYLDDDAALTVILVPDLEGTTPRAQELLTNANQRLEKLGRPTIRRRYVGNFQSMQEQVRIRDCGLDDRRVNLLKPLIIGQLQSRGFEVWNGFFQEVEDRGDLGQAPNTVYVALDGDQQAAQQEPVFWFDIYLTSGEILRQGINRSAYRLVGDMLEKAGEGEEDGLYHLYDLTWAIGFHRQCMGKGEPQ